MKKPPIGLSLSKEQSMAPGKAGGLSIVTKKSLVQNFQVSTGKSPLTSVFRNTSLLKRQSTVSKSPLGKTLK